MAPDTTQAEHPRDPLDGTAVIAPVTDEMMTHAAHEAATLADGVAHHTIARDEPAAETPDAPADVAPPPADTTPATAAGSDADATEQTADAVRAAADDAKETAARAVDDVHATASDAMEATTRIVDEAVIGAEPLAEAARDASSAAADALGQYSTKVFEMMRANAASTTALFAALVQAKSVPEAFSLNADHLRRQMETLTSQGRELTTLAQRIALDAFQPFKDPMGR